MQARHEPFDHGAGDQIERTDARENLRIEKARRAGSVGRTSSRLVFDSSRRFAVPPHRTNGTDGTNGTYESYWSDASWLLLQPALRFRHCFNQLLDDLIRINLLGLSLKIQQHAMP